MPAVIWLPRRSLDSITEEPWQWYHFIERHPSRSSYRWWRRRILLELHTEYWYHLWVSRFIRRIFFAKSVILLPIIISWRVIACYCCFLFSCSRQVATLCFLGRFADAFEGSFLRQDLWLLWNLLACSEEEPCCCCSIPGSHQLSSYFSKECP